MGPKTTSNLIETLKETLKGTFLCSLGLGVAAFLSVPVLRADSLVIPVTKSLNVTIDDIPQVSIDNEPLTQEEVVKAARQLPPKDFEEFQRRRKLFLNYAAKVLNRSRWYVGTKKLVGQKVKTLLEGEPTLSLFHPDPDVIDEFENPGKSQFTRLTVRALKEKLETINGELWLHAPILVHANEFGVMLVVSPNGGVALGPAGLYYSLGAGLAIGYNADKNALYLELLGDFEHFKKGIPGEVELGFTVKASVYVANKDAAVAPYANASATYPLGPFGLEDSSNHFAISFPWTFGIVPSPLDSGMGIKNFLDRKVFFRGRIPILPTRVSNSLKENCPDLMSL